MDSNPFPADRQPYLHHLWKESHPPKPAVNSLRPDVPLTDDDRQRAVAEAERIVKEHASRGRG